MKPGWLVVRKAASFLSRRLDAALGSLLPLAPTLEAMSLRPFELHLELTNLCNANCVFCPYQFQDRDVALMSSEVFEKAVADYVACGGGSVGLTPIVGDPLIDPEFVRRVRRLRSLREIDRIWVTTNGILLDQHGVEAILDCGLTSITISTSGFDEATYRRIYRSTAYRRMLGNVQQLLAANARRAQPLTITLALRTDRSLDTTLLDPDYASLAVFRPDLEFTWSFTSAGGRLKGSDLPRGMRLRKVSRRPETCVQLYNGPIVLPDGTVMACSCVAAMDAVADLGIGNVLSTPLATLWRGERLRQMRTSFGGPDLNKTCAACDMYRDLSLYRSREGRRRAELNRLRAAGQVVKRSEKPRGAFSGG